MRRRERGPNGRGSGRELHHVLRSAPERETSPRVSLSSRGPFSRRELTTRGGTKRLGFGEESGGAFLKSAFLVNFLLATRDTAPTPSKPINLPKSKSTSPGFQALSLSLYHPPIPTPPLSHTCPPPLKTKLPQVLKYKSQLPFKGLSLCLSILLESTSEKGPN